MGKRKINIDFMTFLDFLEKSHNSYYHSYRTALIKKSGEKIYGTAFKLSNKLTDDDKAKLLTWRNVQLFISQCACAPEIKSNLVFVGDKRIR